MTMTTKPRVQRNSDNEVVISASRGVAFAHVAEAIAKLGAVKQPGDRFRSRPRRRRIGIPPGERKSYATGDV